ncbi:MAG: hypothetical protein NWR96_00440, partial [Crocinitomicaceae bacterium]|nr:hypothetical protein [Crocinitomicaceae bacterium]
MGEIENTYDALNVRFFYLVLKVDFTNGCTFSDVYFVQIGQPSIPLESATTPACDPGNYSLSFTNQYPGVSYNIDWDLNDANNPLETYSYPNLPIKPSKVSHIYPFLGCSIGTSQPYQIQVSATNTCGTSTNPAANIYVSEAPEAIFSRSPDLDTICQGTTVTYTNNSISGNYVYPNSGICTQDYNFWWYHSNNTGSGPSVLPNSPNVISPSTITSLGTQLTNGPQTFTVTYNQPGTYTIKLFVKNPACGQDVMEKTVIVLPKAFIPDSTYSICSGSSFSYNPTTNDPTSATVVPSNTTYTWTVAAGPNSSLNNVIGDTIQGSPGVSGPISQTLSLPNTVSTQQQVIYTVTPHTTSGVAPNSYTCDGDTFTITVNVLPGISIPDTTLVICNNGTFSLSPISGMPTLATVVPSSGMNYTWSIDSAYSNINQILGESPGSGTSISGSIQLDINTSIDYSQIYQIKYIVEASAGTTCPSDVFNLTVKINAIDPGMITPDTITICQNSTPLPVFDHSTLPIHPSSTIGDTLNWIWERSNVYSGFTSNPTFPITVPSSSNQNSITAFNSPPGTYYFRIHYTQQLNGVTCHFYSDTSVLVINGVNVPYFSVNQTICSGDNPTSFTISTPASGSGVLSYQWQSATAVSGPWINITPNGTNSTYDPPSGITSTTYYRVIVTSTLGNSACTDTSNVITVTVNDITAGVFVNQTICSGDNPTSFTISTP